MIFAPSQCTAQQDHPQRQQQDGEDREFERQVQVRARQLQSAQQERQDAERGRETADGLALSRPGQVEADQDDADADCTRAVRQGLEHFCDPPQDKEGAPCDRAKIGS